MSPSCESVNPKLQGQWMLADLGSAFTKNGVSINEANCRATGDGHAVNTFKCGILDLDQLRKVVKALEGVKGVHSVERARAHDDG